MVAILWMTNFLINAYYDDIAIYSSFLYVQL